MPARLSIDGKRIEGFCKAHHVRRLALFGSVLRDDFGPDSDLDILVEFVPGLEPGLEFFAMQDELADMLGRRVDLNTPGFLSRHFRDRVVREAEVIYEAS
ncbi:MAG: nucleotidyltransferase family protein [Magnetospirillum sp. WYHS-4]